MDENGSGPVDEPEPARSVGTQELQQERAQGRSQVRIGGEHRNLRRTVFMEKKRRFMEQNGNYGRDWHLWKRLAIMEKKRSFMEQKSTYGEKGLFHEKKIPA